MVIPADVQAQIQFSHRALAALSALLIAAAGVWALSRATRAVEVEVAAVRGLSGSAPTVLNASGYVTARRKATVAAKIIAPLSMR